MHPLALPFAKRCRERVFQNSQSIATSANKFGDPRLPQSYSRLSWLASREINARRSCAEQRPRDGSIRVCIETAAGAQMQAILQPEARNALAASCARLESLIAQNLDPRRREEIHGESCSRREALRLPEIGEKYFRPLPGFAELLIRNRPQDFVRLCVAA